MIVQLASNELFRLRGMRGARLEALQGVLWVTERGLEDDACLPAGGHYVIRGDGLVLVGVEAGGERGRFALRPPADAPSAVRKGVARFFRLPEFQL